VRRTLHASVRAIVFSKSDWCLLRMTTATLSDLWDDFNAARGPTSSTTTLGNDDEYASSSSTPAAKKAKKTNRAPTMTYIKAGAHMDGFMMIYYLQKQLDAAKRIYDDRIANMMSIHAMMQSLSVRMYMPQDLCDMTCKVIAMRACARLTTVAPRCVGRNGANRRLRRCV
jgi:hypothetical protein